MQKKLLKRKVLVLSLTALCSNMSHAEWNYFSSYNSEGVPDNIENRAADLPDDILAQTYKLLPEYQDIRDSPVNLITGDEGANIILKEEAEVRVYFVHEGAYFKNSIAFFTFDPNNKPKTRAGLNEQIIFPNLSQPQLAFGDSIDLGTFQPGQAIGVTLASDGWKDSLGATNPNQPWWSIFTSLQNLNPERWTPGLGAHTALLAKESDELLVVGFEDLNRYWSISDHDFNDAVLVFKVTPFSAVDRSKIISFDILIDSDGDGIPNYADEFPDDAQRASTKYYPSATTFGHLAFEDNWPYQGDYDMNDLVVAYQSVETRNADNEVVDIKLLYEFVARGAGDNNGFAIHIPGVNPSHIKLNDASGNPVTTVQIDQGSTIALTPESGQQEAVFIVADNVTAMTQSNIIGCPFFNTENKCKTQTPIKVEVNIHFSEPQAMIADAPFNPFIFKTDNRGQEIHLVNHSATDLADPQMFDTGDDSSNPANGRYYISQDNYPWALDIPYDWEHPLEYLDINIGYPKFNEWAASGGQTLSDWYTLEKRADRVFSMSNTSGGFSTNNSMGGTVLTSGTGFPRGTGVTSPLGGMTNTNTTYTSMTSINVPDDFNYSSTLNIPVEIHVDGFEQDRVVLRLYSRDKQTQEETFIEQVFTSTSGDYTGHLKLPGHIDQLIIKARDGNRLKQVTLPINKEGIVSFINMPL